MNKYYGKVGFVKSIEKPIGSGIYVEDPREAYYYGDIINKVFKWDTSQSINENRDISITISILADEYAFKNLHYIRYIEYNGELWKVANINPQYPRLSLAIGGVYNGPKVSTASRT